MIARRLSGFIEPCQPSKVDRPPSDPLWAHEIKHDGYRLMVRRDGERVRCLTRNGHDWADRFTGIIKTFRQHRSKSDHFSISYRTTMSELWRNFPPTFSASAGWRCCAVRDRTAISRVFRAMASSIDTRTDVQQANGFLLAQESVACDGSG
jgi:hypothetical protein